MSRGAGEQKKSWRGSLPEMLNRLSDILGIAEIVESIQHPTSNIQNLIRNFRELGNPASSDLGGKATRAVLTAVVFQNLLDDNFQRSK
ncbi:hypothetical protein, partial [Microseira wollei]|uniref:hypothetical protein n=1 Tax=Microseira wollei TaxID=467598 RepID=UPI001CFC47F6